MKFKKDDSSNSILYKRRGKERMLYAMVAIIFLLLALTLIFPMWYLLYNSLKTAWEYVKSLNEGTVLNLPVVAQWGNYIDAFKKISYRSIKVGEVTLLRMFWNSIWQLGLGMAISIPLNAAIGYVMAKYNNKFVDFVFGLVVTSMVVNLGSNTAAFLTLIQKIGLYDKWYFVPITSIGFGQWLYFRSLYVGVPNDYIEAARIDGAGHFTTFFKIMMPQAKGLMVILCVMHFITCWSDYMGPLLYTPSYPTIASGMYNVSTALSRIGSYPIYFAAQILSIIPIILLFVKFSEQIMTGISFGGLKG